MTPLAPLTNTRIFNRPGVIAEGWYWLARTAEIRRGKVKALRLLGRELAVYRGADGTVVALDAYCAHMGAHLAAGHSRGQRAALLLPSLALRRRRPLQRHSLPGGQARRGCARAQPAESPSATA